MHILLTGAAGFIGSNLSDRLLAEGHTISAVDNFDGFYAEPIKRRNLAGALGKPGFQLLQHDIRRIAELHPQITHQGPVDLIVHLAANVGVRPSIDNPLAYQDCNVNGTHTLLEYARHTGVKHFVFASSSSVYGVNPNVPWREDDTVLRPISPYASTKVSGELLGHTYSHLFGIRFVALRFFTVYGPRQRPDLAIHKFARNILAGRPVPMYGDGSTLRDYTYVDDIVSGVLGAIAYQASNYEIMNLGNNEPASLRELVRLLEESLGRRALIERLPEQPGDVPRTCASIEKARSLIGYRPSTCLRDGIGKFATWLASQP